jgi:hypothetical protein
VHARRTRKSAADAAAELASKQISLSAANSQLAAAQAQLEGVEGSLAAKRKELAEVLGQLQAAAVQEFQDAKKLLLEEGERGHSYCLYAINCLQPLQHQRCLLGA